MENDKKYYSQLQEKQVARFFNGIVQPGSGGTRFSGGDVITSDCLIECKTTTSPKKSFAIKKEWMDKVREQAFEQGRNVSFLAFRFEPEGQDYFVFSKVDLMNYLLSKVEE